MDARVKEKYDKEVAKLNSLLDKKAELDAQIKSQQEKVDSLKETLDLGELKDFGTSLKSLGISLGDLKAILEKGGEVTELLKGEMQKNETVE